MAAPTAEEITRASKSNLALAFLALPPERRRDISVFYSFCRVVDDLADEPGLSPEERQRALDGWIAALNAKQPKEHSLARDVRALIEKYALPVEHFQEIIFGCEMDVRGTVYETWEDLRLYCHRVASVVGLVSIEIFGCTDPGSKQYALDLGLALQLTNIIRDVGQDFRADGRIYLPRDEMEQFGYDVGALAVERYDRSFRDLMTFQAERAESYFRSARAALPEADRRALVAAEIMRRVYERLLRKMRRDKFRVFEQRYRLTRWEKAMCVLRGRLGWR